MLGRKIILQRNFCRSKEVNFQEDIATVIKMLYISINKKEVEFMLRKESYIYAKLF